MRGSAVRMCSTLSQGSSSLEYDAVIVGGGIVGLALAAALRHWDPVTAGLRVAVVDRGSFPSPDEVRQKSTLSIPESRVSTITPASVNFLKSVQAWDELSPPRSAAFADMRVWDGGPRSGWGQYVHYTSYDVGMSEMGFVVENSRLRTALLRQITSTPYKDRYAGGAQVELMGNVALEQMMLPHVQSPNEEVPTRGLGDSVSSLATLRLQDGKELQTRLIIGADGAKSVVRKLASIRSMGRSYGQRAIVATLQEDERFIQSENVDHTTAWQKFLPSGPVALLPVRDGYWNIVWSTTPEMSEKLEGMNPEDFAEALNQAMYYENGVHDTSEFRKRTSTPVMAKWVGTPPRSFPLELRHAGTYVLPRLALIGDAAHTIHPMAGQGLNLGLADAKVLAETIIEAIRCGVDIGDRQFLENRYEAPRRKANSVMAGAIDAMQRVWLPQEGPIAGLRRLGLGIINSSPVMKQLITRYAMFGA